MSDTKQQETITAIKALRGVGASGKSLAAGEVYKVPSEVSEADARLLIRLNKAKDVSGAPTEAPQGDNEPDKEPEAPQGDNEPAKDTESPQGGNEPAKAPQVPDDRGEIIAALKTRKVSFKGNASNAELKSLLFNAMADEKKQGDK